MKENKYDTKSFFEQYSKMTRSIDGLRGAGEWHILKTLFPEMKGKQMLDLGCGYGWHCKYAIEQGAKKTIGIDLSPRMIQQAKEINADPKIEYQIASIEDFDYSAHKFDIVLSSLAFHYIESFEDVCKNVYACLNNNGSFIFSVEHPIFTAYGSQQWHKDEGGNILHWPVDNYFYEGVRETNFLGEQVHKYHKTLTTYINNLIQNGFEITSLIEPQPSEELLNSIEGMSDELRRPMMLIISARKK